MAKDPAADRSKGGVSAKLKRRPSALTIASAVVAATFAGVFLWLVFGGPDEAPQQTAMDEAPAVETTGGDSHSTPITSPPPTDMKEPAKPAEPQAQDQEAPQAAPEPTMRAEPQPEPEPTAPRDEEQSAAATPQPANEAAPESAPKSSPEPAQEQATTAAPPPPPPAPEPAQPVAEPPKAAETAETAEMAAPEPAAEEPKQMAAKPQQSPETPAAGSADQASTMPKLRMPESPPSDGRLALAPVPDPALTQRTTKGLLPVISPDGRQPWQAYARPFRGNAEKPRIAIVIVDLGLSQAATKTAIQQLPGAVSLAYSPYARGTQAWIAESRAAGHEVMLQLPMEPYEFPSNDPGPHALLTSLSDEQNLDRLEWLLGRFTGYVGVTNNHGDKFTASAKHLTPVIKALHERGLMFLDLRASDRSMAAKVAKDLGVPRAINNRFIDSPEASRLAIDARLNELERIAQQTGTAVGIGYPRPVTLERIANWAPTLALKGIELVPVTAVVNRQDVQ